MAAKRPLTVAESSSYTATSTHADVLRFLAELRDLADPRCFALQSMGRSGLGQEVAIESLELAYERLELE